MSVQDVQKRKVLFFTAGPKATEQELDLISQIPGNVQTRAPATAGIPANRETADAVAAVSTGTIPAFYKAGEGNLNLPNVTPAGDAAAPYELQIVPNTAGALSAAAAASNIQLTLVGLLAADGTPNLFKMNSGEGLSWESSVPAKATVNSSGVLDLLEAGSTVITASYVYGTTGEGEEEEDLIATATLNVTVT